MTYATVQIITPDGIRYDHHANSISVKTPDGEMGILPGHINLIAPLTVREMKIHRIDDGNRMDQVATNSGIIRVKDDLVTIVVDSAECGRDIDVSRAEHIKIRTGRKLEQAQSTRGTDEVRRAQVTLRRALNHISVGNK